MSNQHDADIDDATELLDGVENILDHARRLIGSSPSSSWFKETASGTEQVTDIDMSIEDLLVSRVEVLRPDSNIISEETYHDRSLTSGMNVVIDPIDGTAQMLRGSSDFAICIAVVISGRCRGAIVDLPAKQLRLRSSVDGTVSINGHPRVGHVARSQVATAVSQAQIAKLQNIAMLGRLRVVGACTPKIVSVITGENTRAVRLPPSGAPVGLCCSRAPSRTRGFNASHVRRTVFDGPPADDTPRRMDRRTSRRLPTISPRSSSLALARLLQRGRNLMASDAQKLSVYMFQVNYSFADGHFLPYSVGSLIAYCLSQPDLFAAYEFHHLATAASPCRRWLTK